MYICQKLLQVYLSGTILQVFVSIYSSIVFTLSVSATNCEIGLIDFLKWFLPSSLCEYINIVIVQITSSVNIEYLNKHYVWRCEISITSGVAKESEQLILYVG